jgi:hypothetical protein
MVTTVNDYEDPTFIRPVATSIACHGLYKYLNIFIGNCGLFDQVCCERVWFK